MISFWYLSLFLKYFGAFPIQFCDVKILTLVTIMDIIWRVHKNNEELQAKLIPFLPLEYKYKVVEYNLLEDSQIPLERKFYAEFHVQGICSKEQFYSFLNAISDLTSTSWNKSHRDISDLSAPRRIFRGERKCHMNVRKQISKITGEMQEVPSLKLNQNPRQHPALSQVGKSFFLS